MSNKDKKQSSDEEKPTNKEKSAESSKSSDSSLLYHKNGNKEGFFKDRFQLSCLKEGLSRCSCSTTCLMGAIVVAVIVLAVICWCVLCLLLKEMKNVPDKSSLSVNTKSNVCQNITGNVHNNKLDCSAPKTGGSSNGLVYLAGFVILIMFFLILLGVVCIVSHQRSLIQLYLDDKDMELQFVKEETKREIEKEETKRTTETEKTKRHAETEETKREVDKKQS